MLKFKGWAQGCVFFLLLFTETERVLLCRKVLEVQLYEFWLKSGLIKYQQGHLEGIFLAKFCKIFFRFEGSLLANCERQSVEEDHYGNSLYGVYSLQSPQYCSPPPSPSRFNTSFHTLLSRLTVMSGGEGRGVGARSQEPHHF